MAETLAVKYRPHTFEDVVSQESILKILKRQLEINQLKHAYLFCGASGCGKTTVARIFANCINQGLGQPIEIDAASHNSVDDVKLLIEDSTKRSLDSKYKIYIIDECHAFGNGTSGTSNKAWQAMLKLIEEPPEYTIFIFCTTDPQKIPATILNRIMRFNFTRINNDIIADRLKYICEAEHFINYTDSCNYISKIAGGSMRNAISLLDKCGTYSNDLSIENTLQALGDFSYTTLLNLVQAIMLNNKAQIISIIEQLYIDGNDLKLFIDKLFNFYLDIYKYVLFKDINMTAIPSALEQSIINITSFDYVDAYYNFMIDEILNCRFEIKSEADCKSTIEVLLLKASQGKR